MKNLILILISLFTVNSFSNAQNDCLQFFPAKQGAVLVNKSYNADKKLIGSLTYRVLESYDYPSGSNVRVEVLLQNSKDSLVGSGLIEAGCDNGAFHMKMIGKSLSNQLTKVLGNNTEIIESFLDIPDDGADDPMFGAGDIESSQFTVESKTDETKTASVRIIDRNYEKDEIVTTPAGAFQASKVTFNFEVTKNKETKTYKGIEWYAKDAGVVKSETYDENNKLKKYTLLTEVKQEEKAK